MTFRVRRERVSAVVVGIVESLQWGGHSVGVSSEGSAIDFMRERRRRGRKWEFVVVVDDVWLHVRTLEAAFVLELSSRLGQAGGHKRWSLVEMQSRGLNA